MQTDIWWQRHWGRYKRCKLAVSQPRLEILPENDGYYQFSFLLLLLLLLDLFLLLPDEVHEINGKHVKTEFVCLFFTENIALLIAFANT